LVQKLLDCCLDDIEKFVVRLQQAANAFSKLQKRRLARKNNENIVGPGGESLEYLKYLSTRPNGVKKGLPSNQNSFDA